MRDPRDLLLLFFWERGERGVCYANADYIQRLFLFRMRNADWRTWGIRGTLGIVVVFFSKFGGQGQAGKRGCRYHFFRQSQTIYVLLLTGNGGWRTCAGDKGRTHGALEERGGRDIEEGGGGGGRGGLGDWSHFPNYPERLFFCF